MHANHFGDSDGQSTKNMICGILTYDGLRPMTPEAYYNLYILSRRKIPQWTTSNWERLQCLCMSIIHWCNYRLPHLTIVGDR